MDFFTRFTREKTPQNNFSSQDFSVITIYGRNSTGIFIKNVEHVMNISIIRLDIANNEFRRCRASAFPIMENRSL